MISHDLWQRRFGGDPAIVGRRLTLNGQTFTVTGVMPPGFAFPRGAELPSPFGFGLRTEVWTPLVFDSTDARNYGTKNLSAVGRLPESGSQLAAQTELSGIMNQFLQENAPNLKLDFRVLSMADQAGQQVRARSPHPAGRRAAGPRDRRRQRGQPARRACRRPPTGAGRARGVRRRPGAHRPPARDGEPRAGGGRHLVGLLIAFWTTKVMLALVPGRMPRADDVGLDWRVLSVRGPRHPRAGGAFGVAAAFAVQWSRLGAALHESDLRSDGRRAPSLRPPTPRGDRSRALADAAHRRSPADAQLPRAAERATRL